MSQALAGLAVLLALAALCLLGWRWLGVRGEVEQARQYTVGVDAEKELKQGLKDITARVEAIEKYMRGED